MFCHNCGTQLDDNAKFCHKCGAQQDNDGMGTRQNFNAYNLADIKFAQSNAGTSSTNNIADPGITSETNTSGRRGGSPTLLIIGRILFWASLACGVLFYTNLLFLLTMGIGLILQFFGEEKHNKEWWGQLIVGIIFIIITVCVATTRQ